MSKRDACYSWSKLAVKQLSFKINIDNCCTILLRSTNYINKDDWGVWYRNIKIANCINQFPQS
jgi:hypothetical protein